MAGAVLRTGIMGIPVGLFWIKFVLTQIVFLSLIIFLVYFLSEGQSQAHVHLSIIAYHILWIMTVGWYFEMAPNYFNIALFYLALIFAYVGFGMTSIESGIENTAHEWFGVLTLVMGTITCVVGTTLTFTVDTYTTNFLFMGLAVATMFLASVALISGMIMNIGYSEWASFVLLIFHVFVITVYTLLTVTVVVYTLYEGGEGEIIPTTSTTTTTTTPTTTTTRRTTTTTKPTTTRTTRRTTTTTDPCVVM